MQSIKLYLMNDTVVGQDKKTSGPTKKQKVMNILLTQKVIKLPQI